MVFCRFGFKGFTHLENFFLNDDKVLLLMFLKVNQYLF